MKLKTALIKLRIRSVVQKCLISTLENIIIYFSNIYFLFFAFLNLLHIILVYIKNKIYKHSESKFIYCLLINLKLIFESLNNLKTVSFNFQYYLKTFYIAHK